jgi:CubicO group peptidase (beta-lactamase class C family)
MMANGGVFKGEQIIGRKTIDVMRSNLLPPEQMKDFTWEYVAGYGYGYGVRTLIDPSAGVNTSVGEFGWTGMMGTYVVMDPAEKASVVYMHNLVPNMEAYIHPRVRNIAFGALK